MENLADLLVSAMQAAAVLFLLYGAWLVFHGREGGARRAEPAREAPHLGAEASVEHLRH